MKLIGLGRSAFLLIVFYALSWPTWAQSKEELVESRTGIDVGFDPTPVEIPSVQKTPPRPVTCMDLLTLRDVVGMQISPDGKYVAFVLQQAVYDSNSYRTGLFVMSTTEGSKPVSLGTAGPPRWDDLNQSVPENPQWSPDDKFIYRTMKSSGLSQVWRWKREGGAPKLMAHVQQNVQSFYLSPDGTKLLLMLETPPTINRKQLEEGGIFYDGSFAATGQSIIDRIMSTPGGEDEPWIVDLTSKKVHKATDREVAELDFGAGPNAGMNEDPLGTTMRTIFTQKEIDELRITSFAISPDHTMVAYSYIVDNPAESKWGEYPLAVRPLAGGPSVTVATWYEYSELFWWSADSKEIYFTGHSADPDDPRRVKLMAVPAQGGKPRAVFESTFHTWMYSVDRFKRFAAFLREDNTTADELAFADLSTGGFKPGGAES
jgi:dipeptidyl aminopeptidase/acylaminoacyl peptidase